MFRSRSRLAADWFAKLRENVFTGQVEQADVADSISQVQTAVADSISQVQTDVADSIAQVQTDVANIDMTTIDGNLVVNGAITATGNITAYN